MRKSITLLLTGLIAIANIHAEENTITLRFTANHTCSYIQLDSVLVENLTLNGSKTFFYPDTVLATVATSTERPGDWGKSLYVTQNYPNPFSRLTDFEIQVPETGLFRISVHDLLGRQLVAHHEKLEPGLHNFTFYACDQHTYLLAVSSDNYMQQRILVQSGIRGGQVPRIVYNGTSNHQLSHYPQSVSTLKATLKSTPGFSFEPGDELRFTGYVTNTFTSEVEYDVITDSPDSDTDYLFEIADRAPEQPSEISGPVTVINYSSNIDYEVEPIPGLTYNWEVPQDWSVISGQGTNAVIVDSGNESGSVMVSAINNCGISPPSTLSISILHELILQASPSIAGTVSGDGNFAEKDQVSITATAESGYYFVNWTDSNGIEVSDMAEFNFEMPGNNLILTANFGKFQTLTLMADPEGAGNLTGDGDYKEGEEVAISASPNPFYRFSGWESTAGNFENADDAQTVFTMPGDDITVTAVFEVEPQQENTFDFLIETTEEQTEFQFVVDGAEEFYIYWGEGNVESYNGNVLPIHDFGEAGEWTVKVHGVATRISFNTADNCVYAPMLRDILTPVHEGVTGIISAYRMFRETTIESFSVVNFFDQVSGNIDNMAEMFSGSSFNQDISSWDVSNVTIMQGMFENCPFDQDVSSWDVSGVIDFLDFLKNSRLSTENYNKLLIEWSKLSLQEDVIFDGGSSKYDLGMPAESRNSLITGFGWTITDGGDTGDDYLSENLTLFAEPAGGGTTGSEGQYHEGGTANIFAVPGPGYEFVNWTGDTDYVNDPQEANTTVTMPAGSVSLTANFIFTATSCRCLLEDGVTASGKYTILLDGTPTEVYCDMTTDGGGWTLVAVSAQGGSQWTWNNRAVFTTNRAVFGSLDDMDLSSQSFANNYKNTGLHDIEMEDVMVRWASDQDSKWASYHNVSDGTQSLSSIIESQPLSACLPHNQGFAKTAGDNFGSLISGTERGYCGERLYFNLRHTGGESHMCGVGETNYSTYGPAFNYRLSHGNCTDGNSGPFNYPNYTGFGPCSNSRPTQFGAARNSNAWTDLGLSSDGQRRSMLLFVR